MAWFTNQNILQFLQSQSLNCHFIVQKERYLKLKTDSNKSSSKTFGLDKWNEHLLNSYKSLKPLQGYSQAVYCLGNIISKKKTRTSESRLMHHKFLVLLDEKNTPTDVITGSFNATANAVNNIENVNFIKNQVVAQQYYNEWQSLLPSVEELSKELKRTVKVYTEKKKKKKIKNIKHKIITTRDAN